MKQVPEPFPAGRLDEGTRILAEGWQLTHCGQELHPATWQQKPENISLACICFYLFNEYGDSLGDVAVMF